MRRKPLQKIKPKPKAPPAPQGTAQAPAGDYESLYRSYVSVRRQVDHLSTLREIGLAVNSSIELSETLPIIANVVQGALDVGKLTIYELEEGGQSVRPLVAKYGRDLIERDRLEGEGSVLQGSPYEESVVTRQVVLINTEYENAAYVPLIAKDSPLGLLHLEDKGDGTEFTQDDAQLFQAVGSQIAMAINNAQLYSLAVTDGLTRLYVRRYFDLRMEEEFHQARRYGRTFSLLMFDIDHFKNFNDTHGHQTGDTVLRQFSAILQNETRKSDLCCRYGGEEMAIVLPESNIEEAVALAQKLCAIIAKHPFGDEDNTLNVTTSIGAIEYSDDFEGTSEMIKGCDAALYKAKEQGRNRVVLADSSG